MEIDALYFYLLLGGICSSMAIFGYAGFRVLKKTEELAYLVFVGQEKLSKQGDIFKKELDSRLKKIEEESQFAKKLSLENQKLIAKIINKK